jgi:hypothetical protein
LNKDAALVLGLGGYLIFRMEVRFVRPTFGFMKDQTSKAVFTAKSDSLPKQITLNKMNCLDEHLPKGFSRFQNGLNCTPTFPESLEIN